MEQPKRQLYAVAYERYRRSKSRKGVLRLASAGIEYMHADSAAHARNQFCYSYPNRRTHRVVAVGVALGYHVEDNHGEKLIA